MSTNVRFYLSYGIRITVQSLKSHFWCENVKVHHIQEVFHVYLNKIENAVTHLFFIIFGNY